MNRLNTFLRHLEKRADVEQKSLQRAETSSVRTLPRFDSYVLGHYIDDLYEFKQSVYEEFRSRPDLLPAVIEGLTKGNLTTGSETHSTSKQPLYEALSLMQLTWKRVSQ